MAESNLAYTVYWFYLILACRNVLCLMSLIVCLLLFRALARHLISELQNPVISLCSGCAVPPLRLRFGPWNFQPSALGISGLLFTSSPFHLWFVRLSSDSHSVFYDGFAPFQGIFLGTLITCCLGYFSFGNSLLLYRSWCSSIRCVLSLCPLCGVPLCY